MAPQTGSHVTNEPAPIEENPATHRPRGYTMADEEMERIEQKLAAGNVLDPIALEDPVGQSVETVILRVGIAVVSILVVGLLLAQVMCKNLQVMGIPDFTQGATASSVDDALSHGILWGGDIVRFPSESTVAISDQGDAVMVTVTNTAPRTLEQLVAVSQAQATALAMNIFHDEAVSTVVYVVRSGVDDSTGAFDPGSSITDDWVTVTWRRSDTSDTFVCSIAGFEPLVATSKAELAAR